MAQSRSSEAVDKLLDIASQGGQGIGSAEDRAEDVGGIIHYEHIQLYVNYPLALTTSSTRILQSMALAC